MTRGPHPPYAPLDTGALLSSLLDAGVLLGDLEADPRALDLALRRAVWPGPEGRRVVLVVDQFEELFTLCRDEGARRRFLDALVDVTGTPEGPAAVVVALRADFCGHGAVHPGLARMLEAHSLLLGPIDEDGLRAVVEGPAEVAGLALDPGLADLVVRDVAGEPGALPLLSHALAEVWARREAGTLTVAAYREIGGVGGAIARTAETVYERFDAEDQRLVRDVFVRLVELVRAPRTPPGGPRWTSSPGTTRCRRPASRGSSTRWRVRGWSPDPRGRSRWRTRR